MKQYQQISKTHRVLFFILLTFFLLSLFGLAVPSPNYAVLTRNLNPLNGEAKRRELRGITKLPGQPILRLPGSASKDSFPRLPGLQHFIGEVFTGEKGIIRGVYVPGVFAYPIIQQPSNNDIYVSNKTDLITQFHQADHNGITGLLAHNYLTGKFFFDLEIGQEIWIVYGDRELRHYQVTSLHQFQKIDTSSLYSPMLDLNTQEELSTSEVYSQFYRGAHHVVFQTCLAGEGRLDWGLFFVTAMPIDP